MPSGKPIEHDESFTKFPTKPSPQKFTAMRRGIGRVRDRATPGDMEHGRIWYPQAHDFASQLARGDITRGAGAVAALSPQQDWGVNMQMARELPNLRSADVAALRQGDRSPLQGKKLNNQSSANVLKAHEIWAGRDPTEVLRMDVKTGNFFRNVEDPSNPQHVTVDTHAHDLALGKQISWKSSRGLDVASRYSHFAEAYRQEANRRDELPNVTQATTWVTWRRERGH